MDNDTLLAEEMQEQVRATQEIVRKVSLTTLFSSFLFMPMQLFIPDAPFPSFLA